MSKASIQSLIEQVRNETQLHGNTRERIASLLTQLNSEKLDRPAVESIISEITNLSPLFFDQFGNIIDQLKSGIYNDLPETLAGDILKRVDFYTGEDVNYKETLYWLDGTLMDDSKIDNVVFIKRDSKYYKRVVTDYADVRWFGAKGDGIDSGIGNYDGDHEAINLALTLCKKVKLQDGTFIAKKPIVLNDGNELFIYSDAVLKLGDASNCTLLKNSHVDILTDNLGNPTYPTGFKRHSNIRVINEGLIDCNGWMQNRANDVTLVKDNPDVISTPFFRDNPNHEYIGFAIKFADIDNFYLNSFTKQICFKHFS